MMYMRESDIVCQMIANFEQIFKKILPQVVVTFIYFLSEVLLFDVNHP